MEMICSGEVDLLLIGKTGNGKSATGNSILRRRAFKSEPSMTAVTSTVDSEVSEFNGRIIKVVDCPGVGDNRLSTDAAVNLVMTAMEHAISANPRGYHASLLVVRFGDRFTAEDQDTIDFLKKIFGPDFVKQFCILVLTRGDKLEQQSEQNSISFQQWCEQQGGDFKHLLMECDNRVVLFDNVTRDPAKKNKQIANLLKVVDNLSSRGKRYIDENFALALEARDRIIVESQRTIIEEKTMTETSLILFEFEKLMAEEDLRSKVEPLEKLQVRVESLLKSLESKDRKTGTLYDLISSVKSIQRNVSDEIKFCFRMMEERERVRRREEENRRKHEDEMKLLKDQYDRIRKVDERLFEVRIQFERQKERLEKEMTEKSKQERDKLDKKYKQEKDRIKKEFDELENRYRKVKQDNGNGMVLQIYNKVAWPLRAVRGWVASHLSQRAREPEIQRAPRDMFY